MDWFDVGSWYFLTFQISSISISRGLWLFSQRTWTWIKGQNITLRCYFHFRLKVLCIAVLILMWDRHNPNNNMNTKQSTSQILSQVPWATPCTCTLYLYLDCRPWYLKGGVYSKTHTHQHHRQPQVSGLCGPSWRLLSRNFSLPGVIFVSVFDTDHLCGTYRLNMSRPRNLPQLYQWEVQAR